MMSRGLVEQSVKKEKIKDKKKLEQETEETSCSMIQSEVSQVDRSWFNLQYFLDYQPGSAKQTCPSHCDLFAIEDRIWRQRSVEACTTAIRLIEERIPSLLQDAVPTPE
jgi:hypothetical protein